MSTSNISNSGSQYNTFIPHYPGCETAYNVPYVENTKIKHQVDSEEENTYEKFEPLETTNGCCIIQ